MYIINGYVKSTEFLAIKKLFLQQIRNLLMNSNQAMHEVVRIKIFYIYFGHVSHIHYSLSM